MKKVMIILAVLLGASVLVYANIPSRLSQVFTQNNSNSTTFGTNNPYAPEVNPYRSTNPNAVHQGYPDQNTVTPNPLPPGNMNQSAPTPNMNQNPMPRRNLNQGTQGKNRGLLPRRQMNPGSQGQNPPPANNSNQGVPDSNTMNQTPPQSNTTSQAVPADNNSNGNSNTPNPEDNNANKPQQNVPQDTGSDDEGDISHDPDPEADIESSGGGPTAQPI